MDMLLAEVSDSRAVAIDDSLAAPVVAADEVAETDLVEEELLVEEISIDGMCGVY